MGFINKEKTSFANALRGVYNCLSKERHFQYQVCVLLILILLSVAIGDYSYIFIIGIFLWLLIMVCEMVNTAIEKICDFIQPNSDIRIREIKDISAGAVLLSLIIFTLFMFIVIIETIGIESI